VASQAVSFKEQPVQLFSWLTKRMTGRPQSRRAPACRPVPRFRPQLEALEERWALSTLTVLNNLDSGAGSLRAEIAAAKSNDTIVFGPSLSGQTINLTSGELLIQKNLTIAGPGAGQLAISGGGASRVFEVSSKQGLKEQVTLSGLTICNGHASNFGIDGGGILNLGTLTVSGCILSGNTAGSPPLEGGPGNGGGIYNAGTLTVRNSTLSSNQAGVYGGGIYNAGTATISGSTLSSPLASNGFFDPNAEQAANDGGGIYNAGTLTVNSCTFFGNFAEGHDTFGSNYGGAIFNAGRLTVSNSAFSQNFADGPSNNIFGQYTDGGGNTFA
jgi:hypothetical protein